MESLIGAFLADQLAVTFLINKPFDVPDCVPGTVDRIGDLSNVVAEPSQPQDFAIICHDHRPPWINSRTVVCHIHYMRKMVNWAATRDSCAVSP